MSIETSIDKLADALFAVAAAINGKADTNTGNVQPGKSSGKPASTPGATQETKAAKSETAGGSRSEGKSGAKTPPADTPSTAEEGEADAASGKAVSYDEDIKPLFLKLVSAKGRDVARALIDSYKPNAAKLSDAITEEQYAEVLAKLQAELS